MDQFTKERILDALVMRVEQDQFFTPDQLNWWLNRHGLTREDYALHWANCRKIERYGRLLRFFVFVTAVVLGIRFALVFLQ